MKNPILFSDQNIAIKDNKLDFKVIVNANAQINIKKLVDLLALSYHCFVHTFAMTCVVIL